MSNGTHALPIPQWRSPTLADADEYMGATPPEHHRHVMPMWCFDVEERRAIEQAVLAPEPPPKWLHFAFCWMESRAWYEWHWHRGIDPDKRREPIPSGLRQMVIERDGYVCGICGGVVEPTDVHLDHIKPWSKGGRHSLANLRVTHSRCNIRRGNREDN